MVRATELGASGGETTASNGGGGHSGAESDGSIHLDAALDTIDGELIVSEHTFVVRANRARWSGVEGNQAINR